MEKQYITQCPECATQFKVSLAQMNKAQGLVRCGECMHVFSADKHLQTATATATANHPPQEKRFIPEIPIQIRHEEMKKPLLGRFIWGSLFFLSCSLLVAQILWFERDQLSRQPLLSPLYFQACKLIDCSLNSRQDISQITNHQLVVRDHPKYLGVLAIDVLMENKAAFSQPFPAIQLVFTDLKGDPKAARNFQPSEYLGGDFSGKRLMPSNKPIQVQLEVIAPGAQAPNYRLQFVQSLNNI